MPHIIEASLIDTARLRLRPMQFDDAPQVHRLWTERAMLRRIWEADDVEFAQSLAVIESSVELFETRSAGLWCVYTRDEDLLAGFCGFWWHEDVPERVLCGGISSLHTGCGFASETARALLRHGFEYLGFDKVVFRVGDPRLRRLAEKLGFRFDRRQVVAGSEQEFHAVDRASLRDGGTYRLVQRPQPVLRER